MASTDEQPSPAAESTGLSPAQERAKRQRERRQAKIAAGGSSRLDAITSLSGRTAPAETPPTSTTPEPSSTSPAPGSAAPDPDEIDISQHHYTPAQSQRSQNALNPFGVPSSNATPNRTPSPFPGAEGMDMNSMNDDPMAKMLAQMLGGDPNDPSAGEGLPPGLAQMLGAATGAGGPGGANPFAQQQQQQQGQSASGEAYLWRIVHFVFALGLALYVALWSGFSGTQAARVRSEGLETDDVDMHGVGRRLFWMFATAELVLQSSRYFVERGQLPPSGILGTLSGFLPEPWAGYIRVIGRYGVIYSTVVADAMVVVFVLGVVAWVKGELGT